MLNLDQLKEISTTTPSKIVLLVIDGLGGIPRPDTGKTELETARHPNLDNLASKGVCGLSQPVGWGITPGSAPGHLALFGYDPARFVIGRGILETLGIDFDVKSSDVAARGNFCTVDATGVITDRRAGRIPTESTLDLCQKLSQIKLADARVFVEPVKEHRFVAVFRGDGLSDEVSDTDPQREGLRPLPPRALSPNAEKTARIAAEFVEKAQQVLAAARPANMVLFRGFSKHPALPTMNEIFKVSPAAIASYPMYRGLAKLVGMDILKTGPAITDEFDTLERDFSKHDYFYVHIKKTDAAGEDGNFDAKVHALEDIDSFIPRLTRLDPDVIVVAGDHSTPAVLKGHSWHPVPFLLFSKCCRPDRVTQFTESACIQGALGTFPALATMPLAMANALKLNKFGA